VDSRTESDSALSLVAAEVQMDECGLCFAALLVSLLVAALQTRDWTIPLTLKQGDAVARTHL